MKALPLVRAIVAMAVAALPEAARAQAAGFAVDRFEPAARGSDWFVCDSLDLRGTHRPAAGLTLDWAYKPLVLHDKGAIPADVLTDQIFVHTGGGIILADRLRIQANLPIAVYQHGDDLRGVAVAARSPDTAAVGDLGVTGDARLAGSYGEAFTMSAGARVVLPTGSRANFTGDGTARLEPRLLFAGTAEGIAYAAKLGLAYRPFAGPFEGSPLGSEIVFNLAAGVKVNDRFTLGPELYGSTVLEDALGARTTPLEMLLGARAVLAEDFRIGVALGPGITTGDGTPRMRVVASIELAPDYCVDKDGDGICAAQDACPEVDGARTTDRKTNGCPADRDGDRIIDKEDACPDLPGWPTLDPKEVGCPDADRDQVADRADACPKVAGTASDDPKTNGCPADRDHDGVPDTTDACPEAKGTETEDPKTSGCPQEKAPSEDPPLPSDTSTSAPPPAAKP